MYSRLNLDNIDLNHHKISANSPKKDNIFIKIKKEKNPMDENKVYIIKINLKQLKEIIYFKLILITTEYHSK